MRLVKENEIIRSDPEERTNKSRDHVPRWVFLALAGVVAAALVGGSVAYKLGQSSSGTGGQMTVATFADTLDSADIPCRPDDSDRGPATEEGGAEHVIVCNENSGAPDFFNVFVFDDPNDLGPALEELRDLWAEWQQQEQDVLDQAEASGMDISGQPYVPPTWMIYGSNWFTQASDPIAQDLADAFDAEKECVARCSLDP